MAFTLSGNECVLGVAQIVGSIDMTQHVGVTWANSEGVGCVALRRCLRKGSIEAKGLEYTMLGFNKGPILVR